MSKKRFLPKTPEHNIWYTMLGTYFEDASSPNISDRNLDKLIESAEHPWTKYVCLSIDLEWNSFVKAIKEKIEQNRSRRNEWRSDYFKKSQLAKNISDPLV